MGLDGNECSGKQPVVQQAIDIPSVVLKCSLYGMIWIVDNISGRKVQNSLPKRSTLFPLMHCYYCEKFICKAY